MSIETLQYNDDLRYATDEYGYRRMRSDQEIAVIKLREQLKDYLCHSSLSTDDMQRLRSLSADYNVICAPFPDDDKVTRRTVLDNLSSDIPEANEIDATGLCRLSSSLHGTTIVVDGYPMPVSELELVYTLIEPSTDVLDRAVNDAAYFSVVSNRDEQVTENRSVEVDSQVPTRISYDTDLELPLEEKHTLRDELRPITDQLRHIGGKVISIVGLRPSVDNEKYQKIAS